MLGQFDGNSIRMRLLQVVRGMTYLLRLTWIATQVVIAEGQAWMERRQKHIGTSCYSMLQAESPFVSLMTRHMIQV